MKRRQQGFTLIEVLIAVAVLALVMVVMGQTIGSTARAYTNINETRLGYMVAADKLVELQVYQQWPGTGTSDSQVERGGRTWWIRTHISDGPYPDTRRVDIDVGVMADHQKGPLAYSLASLIGKPVSS